MVDRIFESVAILAVIFPAMNLLGLPNDGRDLIASVRSRWVPVSALVITIALMAGVLVGALWAGALSGLSGGGASWQIFTAPFVQDDGIIGTGFNVISALVIIALGAWIWGDVTAAVLWLVGAWAPIGELAHLVGYRVSSRDLQAYSVGSSGATYFFAGTICAAVLLCALGPRRWLGLVAPAIGLLMWLGSNDGHGVVLVEGFVLGLAVGVPFRLFRDHRRSRRTIPDRLTGVMW